MAEVQASRDDWKARAEKAEAQRDRLIAACECAEPWAHVCEGAQVSMTPAASTASVFPHLRGCPGCELRATIRAAREEK